MKKHLTVLRNIEPLTGVFVPDFRQNSFLPQKGDDKQAFIKVFDRPCRLFGTIFFEGLAMMVKKTSTVRIRPFKGFYSQNHLLHKNNEGIAFSFIHDPVIHLIQLNGRSPSIP
jgi:hypothetical protein